MDKQIAQKHLLDIMCVFDALCTEHHIRYTLHAGTLLGAVRGKDFIPWDDDADVALTRADYEKLEKAMEAAPSEYYIRGNIKKQFCKKDNPDIWVDLFVCDHITDNKLLRKVKLGLLTVLDVMNRDRESMKLSNLSKYSRAKQLIYKIVFTVGQIFPKHWLIKSYLHIGERWFRGNKQSMFRSSDHYVGRARIFPSEWMEHYKRIPFADCDLPVIKDHDALLLQCYGIDYMTPIFEERNGEVHDLMRSGNKMEL